MPYRPRILILPAAAIIIAALCGYRIANPRGPAAPGELPPELRPAPSFTLYDQESTLVNLEAFLHRHRIAIVFYDGSKGPESNPVLMELREFHPALKRENVIVLGVSTALPQENRNNSSQPFPFPLLTDAAPLEENSVHRTWNRLLEPASPDMPPKTKPGVFVIDRQGLVAWDGEFPKPESDGGAEIVARLLGG